MAAKEENPSKRRKLNSPEDSKSSAMALTANLEDKIEPPNGQETPEYEENDISRIEVEGPTNEGPPLSKTQMKKRRKDAAWQAAKDSRKDKRRDKRKERQARKAGAKAELEEKIARGEIEAPPVSAEELKIRHRRPVLVPVTLIMDCDFDELMTEKELISLGAQLTRCYSDNRHSKHRAHVVISSWLGPLRTRFETVLTNHHKGWKGVRFMEKDFIDAAQEMEAIMRSRDGGRLVGAFAPLDEKPLEINGASTEEENGPGSISVEDGHPPPGELPSLEDPQALEPDDNLQSDGQLAPSPHEEPLTEQHSSTPETIDPATTSFRPESSSQPAPPAKESKPEAAASSELPPPSEPSIVYLTSDSPHTLERLSPNTSYIIGGIVDKNRHKGLCYKRACQRGISTAKLPIGEYMTMQSRTVLAVNHVVEIMLKWLETGDWGEAFLSVIPKRKEAKLRVKKDSRKENGEAESEDEDDCGEPMKGTVDDGIE